MAGEKSMVLALLLTLVASALAQTFPRGPDPPGQPNNIFSYAQYKTDNQFTRSVFITISLPYGLAELTGEVMDRYQNAMAQVFSSKDFPKTGKADIFVDSITDGYIPTKYDTATRRRLLQVQAVNNVNLATKIRAYSDEDKLRCQNIILGADATLTDILNTALVANGLQKLTGFSRLWRPNNVLELQSTAEYEVVFEHVLPLCEKVRCAQAKVVGSEQEFSWEKQIAYTQAVANAVDMNPTIVSILLIKDSPPATRRQSSLTFSTTVKTSLKASSLEQADKLKLKLTPARLNAQLSQKGLPPVGNFKAAIVYWNGIEGSAWQFRTATIVLGVFCGLLLILSLCLCCCWPWTKKPVAVLEKPLKEKEKVVYYEVPGPQKVVEITKNIETPGPVQLVQGPERVVHVQGPTRVVRELVEGPERIMYVPGPERVVHVEGPERVVHVQGPERVVHVQGPERIVEKTVMVQAPMMVQQAPMMMQQQVMYQQQPIMGEHAQYMPMEQEYMEQGPYYGAPGPVLPPMMQGPYSGADGPGAGRPMYRDDPGFSSSSAAQPMYPGY